ncbi:PilZ domain-containing protein [Bacillaceae bacterium S4-13-56]
MVRLRDLYHVPSYKNNLKRKSPAMSITEYSNVKKRMNEYSVLGKKRQRRSSIRLYMEHRTVATIFCFHPEAKNGVFDKWEGRIQDIGLDGLCFVSTDPIMDGPILMFDFILFGQPYRCFGKVVWSRKEVDGSLLYGIDFFSTLKQQEERKKLIQDEVKRRINRGFAVQ